jgi:hypothetical protein
MAMNLKGRKEPQFVEPSTGRIDFKRLAEDIERSDTPRVSEYAPSNNHSGLRERIEQTSRLNLQEAADACNAMITDMMELVKEADVRHAAMHRSSEEMVNTVHEALKRHQAEIVRHSEHMSRICEVTEMVRNETAPKASAKPVESGEPITEETPTAER